MKKERQGDGPLLTPQNVKKLAALFGRSAAIFVKQLEFWISSPKGYGVVYQEKRWIFNSLEEWADQLCCSRATVARNVSTLLKQGLLEVEKLSKNKTRRTNYYTLNYAKLQEALGISDSSFQTPIQLEVSQESSVYRGAKIQPQQDDLQPHACDANSVLLRWLPSQDETIHISNNLQNTTFSLEKSSQEKRGGEEPLVETLLSIWNEITGQQCQLTFKRIAYLKAAFRTRFESNLDKWKAFCQRVASSDFLMGRVKSTFRASLDWVLNFDTITRIFEGDFGVRDLQSFDPRGSEEIAQQEALQAEVRASKDSSIIKMLRLELLKTFGASTYRSWFEKLQMRQGEGGLRLISSSDFFTDYLQSHFGWKLETIVGNKVSYETAV
ncbi:MAG: DnaA N-terminal domain-containing protein [Alphaproteobacteria bacterium]